MTVGNKHLNKHPKFSLDHRHLEFSLKVDFLLVIKPENNYKWEEV